MNRLIKHIPKDWKVNRFDKVFEFLPTLTLSRNDLTSDESYTGIYNIHYGDIHSTYKFVELNFEREKFIPKITKENIDETKLTFLKTGDIVIVDASEDYEGVAACVELANVGDRKVTAGLHTFAARDKNNLTFPGFRAYLLKHPWVNNELKKLATGSKVYGISKTNIAKLEVVLPPLPEQQKIAAILSKWDELIEQQTQLIAAKEKQKTSLMQKLLTGEVRFPGFEGEWEYEKIGSICKTYSGGTPRRNKKEYYGGQIPWIKSGELNTSNIYKTEEYITELGLKNSSAKLVPENTVLLAMYGATAGVIAITRIEATLNQAILAILPNETLTFSFLYFYLNFVMPYELQRLIQGGQPNLSADVVKSIDLAIPSIAEQEKITSFLSNCDDEIQLLKDELAAIQLQKKGLMQQLLTGKIRVKL